jgi:hypothetical protein
MLIPHLEEVIEKQLILALPIPIRIQTPWKKERIHSFYYKAGLTAGNIGLATRQNLEKRYYKGFLVCLLIICKSERMSLGTI